MNVSAAQPDEALAGDGEGGTPRLTLAGFTGPLEQLLVLARARRVDLAGLSLVALVDQLNTALRQASPTLPLGQMGDWLVMAAWLLLLRSLLLLPTDAPARQAAESEADQLRARLLALRRMQTLAGWLQQRPQLGRDVFARGQPEAFGVALDAGPALDVIEFLWASLALFEDDLPVADTATTGYQPRWRDRYAVAEARARILRLLGETPEARPLDTLLPAVDADGADTPLRQRSAWTSTFIASLELARQGKVVLAQEAFLKPIHVSASSASLAPRDPDDVQAGPMDAKQNADRPTDNLGGDDLLLR